MISQNGLCLFPGASAAAMLIFILPSAFYIKLVKKEPMKSVQKIGVSGIFCSTGTVAIFQTRISSPDFNFSSLATFC